MASLALAVRADDNQEAPIAVLIREMASPSIDDRESLPSTTRAAGFVLVPADLEGYPAAATVTVWLYDL